MTSPKTIREHLASYLKFARRDLDSLDTLRQEAGPRGLSVDEIDAATDTLADWIAIVAWVHAHWSDPRDTPAWRASTIAKALDRLRAQRHTAK